MKHTFKLKDIIKAIKTNDEGFYGVLETVEGVPDEIIFVQTDDIDESLLKMVKRKRDKLSCDIFVDDLPKAGWYGGIHKLIKPEFHKLIMVDGQFSDVNVLQLMLLVGIKKITIKGNV